MNTDSTTKAGTPSRQTHDPAWTAFWREAFRLHALLEARRSARNPGGIPGHEGTPAEGGR